MSSSISPPAQLVVYKSKKMSNILFIKKKGSTRSMHQEYLRYLQKKYKPLEALDVTFERQKSGQQ